MDIYTENQVVEMKPENDRRPDDISSESVWVGNPNDIFEEPVVATTVTNVPKGAVVSEDEIKKWKETNKGLPKKVEDAIARKDWPGNRCYLYGLTTEYNPIAYRYIPRNKMSVNEQIRERDNIVRDFPNVVLIYIVDNSKDIHEAFNRAKSKYRPSEDRAIFKCMLENKGIKLYEEKEDK